MEVQAVPILPLVYAHEASLTLDGVSRGEPLASNEIATMKQKLFASEDVRLVATRREGERQAALMLQEATGYFALLLRNNEGEWQPQPHFGDVAFEGNESGYYLKVRVMPTEEERVAMVCEDEALRAWAMELAQKLLEYNETKKVFETFEEWAARLNGWEADAPGASMEWLRDQAIGWLMNVERHPKEEVRIRVPIWNIFLVYWQNMPEKGVWDHLAALNMAHHAFHLLLQDRFREFLEQD